MVLKACAFLEVAIHQLQISLERHSISFSRILRWLMTIYDIKLRPMVMCTLRRWGSDKSIPPTCAQRNETFFMRQVEIALRAQVVNANCICICICENAIMMFIVCERSRMLSRFMTRAIDLAVANI